MKHSKDFDVRCAVVRQLLAEGVERRDIRHEITLDTSSSAGRVDLAVMRDSMLIGVEIKSGKDKLDRLPDQCRGMHRAFDYVRVVIDTRLGRSARAGLWAVSPHWYSHETGAFVEGYRGDWMPQSEPRLSWPEGWVSRRSTTVDMASLLWKEEVCQISVLAGGRGKTRTDAIDWIRENMTLKDLRPAVIKALRNRVPNRWEEAFWRDFDALREAA